MKNSYSEVTFSDRREWTMISEFRNGMGLLKIINELLMCSDDL